MGSISVLFPGQGTQAVGMASDVIKANGAGKRLLEKISGIVDYDIINLMQNGPAEELHKTVHAQLAVVSLSLAMWEDLKDRFPEVVRQVGHMAGFSAGEFAVIIASGVVPLEEGIKLVALRARAMQETGEKSLPGGTMIAVRADGDTVASLLEVVNAKKLNHTGHLERVYLSNQLFPLTVAVSGSKDGIEDVIEECGRRGLETRHLQVTGAFHTPYMEEGRKAVLEKLKGMELAPTPITLYLSTTGRAFQPHEDLKELLARQTVTPVLWTSINQEIAKVGGDIYELGHTRLLQSLMEKTNHEAFLRFKFTRDLLYGSK